MKKAESVIPAELLTFLSTLKLQPCIEWSTHHCGPNIQIIMDFRKSTPPPPVAATSVPGGPEKRTKKKSPSTVNRDIKRLEAWREKKTQADPKLNRGEQKAERTTAELNADLRTETPMELHSSQESIPVSTAYTSADEGSYDCEAMEAIEAMSTPVPLLSPLKSTSTPPPKHQRRSPPPPAPPKEATTRTSDADKDQVVRKDLLRLKKTVSEEDEEHAREIEDHERRRAEVQEALRSARLMLAEVDELQKAKAKPSSTKKKKQKKKAF